MTLKPPQPVRPWPAAAAATVTVTVMTVTTPWHWPHWAALTVTVTVTVADSEASLPVAQVSAMTVPTGIEPAVLVPSWAARGLAAAAAGGHGPGQHDRYDPPWQ